MNPEALRAWFEKNKKGVAAAGAGVVVVLALVSKRGKPSTPDAAAPASSSLSAGGAPTSSIPIASQYTGGGTYDSTASDVFGALAPMLERNNELLARQSSPIPVPAAPSGFFRPAGETAVYQFDGNGKRDWLNLAEYTAMGSPQVTDVSRDNAIWKNTQVVGQDSPKAARIFGTS